MGNSSSCCGYTVNDSSPVSSDPDLELVGLAPLPADAPAAEEQRPVDFDRLLRQVRMLRAERDVAWGLLAQLGALVADITASERGSPASGGSHAANDQAGDQAGDQSARSALLFALIQDYANQSAASLNLPPITPVRGRDADEVGVGGARPGAGAAVDDEELLGQGGAGGLGQ